MSTESVRYERITRTWAFLFLAITFVFSIALERTIAPGRGKAIFFATFMAGCAIKTAQKVWRDSKVLALLFCVVVLHAALVFVIPLDDQYAGGLLFPAAILDYVVFYLIFQKVAQGL